MHHQSQSSSGIREIRATFDESTITVYQAYSAHIAIPAASAGSFAGTPFKLDRMTWIKPSFLWMMYRSGWATKPGQEHVLAVRLTREGFEKALSLACLSHYDPSVYSDREAWQHRKQNSPVRVQWDPERDLDMSPLPMRSLQLGLSGTAVHSYVDSWIVEIIDISSRAHSIRRHLDSGCADEARALLPAERPYPLSADLRAILGAH